MAILADIFDTDSRIDLPDGHIDVSSTDNPQSPQERSNAE